jgi:hypothetical protein
MLLTGPTMAASSAYHGWTTVGTAAQMVSARGVNAQNHGEGVTLGDPFSREDDLAVAATPAKEELGRVPVAVDAKPGS